MKQVVIENPILNSPYVEPTHHFRFTDEGITNEIVDGRRTSSYFVPIAKARKKGTQLQIETEWTQDRTEETIPRPSGSTTIPGSITTCGAPTMPPNPDCQAPRCGE